MRTKPGVPQASGIESTMKCGNRNVVLGPLRFPGVLVLIVVSLSVRVQVGSFKWAFIGCLAVRSTPTIPYGTMRLLQFSGGFSRRLAGSLG